MYTFSAPETLQRHTLLNQAAHGGSAIEKALTNPYFIGVMGALLWVAVISLILYCWYVIARTNKKNALCRRYRRWRRRNKSAHSPFIKINDGSVLTARDTLWIDPNMTHAYNTTQRQLGNGHIGNGTSGYGSHSDVHQFQVSVQTKSSIVHFTVFSWKHRLTTASPRCQCTTLCNVISMHTCNRWPPSSRDLMQPQI